MRNTFLVHLVLIVFLNLLIKPLAIFGIDAQVQNVVGPSEYGFYFSLLNFTYLFNIFLDVGITNFNTKYIAQYPHLAKNYIGKIIPLRLLLLGSYILISLSLAFVLNYNSKQYQILYILILNQFLTSAILYIRSYFSGLLMLKLDIFLSIFDKLLLILIMGWVLYFDSGIQVTVFNFVSVQSLTLLFSLIFAVSALIYKVGFPSIKWHWTFNRFIIKKSFPYALLIVLMMLYNRVDSVMLERLLADGEYEAGIYAQSYRLLDAFFMFASLFSGLLYPLFARTLNDKNEIKSLLEVSSNILLPGSILLAGICFIDWEFILNLFYTNDISYTGQVFQILMFSFIPICITLLFGTLLTVNGNLKLLNWVSLIGIMVNIALNIYFIPIYGALGTTYISLFTQLVVALIQLLYVVKLFELGFSKVLMMKYLGLISLIVLYYFISNFVSIELNHSLVLLILGVIYLFLTKLIDLGGLVKLVKSKGN